MFTIKEVAQEIGLKVNTLRYWLKKNANDYDYEFNLNDLFMTLKVYKKVTSRNNLFRKYKVTVVSDMQEFKTEFYKYFDYVNYIKQRKRNSKLSWTSSAIDCYSCNMDCRECSNKDICKNFIGEDRVEPPMKGIVRKLLSDIGKPQI